MVTRVNQYLVDYIMQNCSRKTNKILEIKCNFSRSNTGAHRTVDKDVSCKYELIQLCYVFYVTFLCSCKYSQEQLIC